MKSLCVLVSGNGTTLQSIIDAVEDGTISAVIAAVISSRQGAYALERAREHGIQALAMDYTALGRETYDDMLYRKLIELSPDLICLAGYLKILNTRTVREFEGRIINIHPALLPEFGGKGMYGERVHEAVLRSGAGRSGCSVHFVTEGIDAGPVILQESVPVMDGDTAKTLASRVHEEEKRVYPRAINLVLSGRVQMH